MKALFINASRVLLAIYFLIPGVAKFTSCDMDIAHMETHNMIMVPFLLAIAAVVQIVGSIYYY